MKKVELILVLFAATSIAIHFQNILETDALLIVSLSALALYYYLFGFLLFNKIELKNVFRKMAYKGLTLKCILGSVILGITISGILTGMLTKLRMLSDGNAQFVGSLVLMASVMLTATYYYLQRRYDFLQRAWKRAFVYGGIGILTYLTPFSTLIDVYYHSYPEYAELKKEVMKYPSNRALRDKLEAKANEIWYEDAQNQMWVGK